MCEIFKGGLEEFVLNLKVFIEGTWHVKQQYYG